MKNPTKYYSSIQERKVADYLGWNVVSGSGSRSFYPGDIISDSCIGECKTHTEHTEYIEFKRDVWNKIESEATSRFKYPVLIVDDGSQILSHTWCMFSYTITLPSICIECKYEKKYRTNIKADILSLNESYKRAVKDYPDRIVVLSVETSDRIFYTARLEEFKELFGGK